jgi:hypothetical protein
MAFNSVAGESRVWAATTQWLKERKRVPNLEPLVTEVEESIASLKSQTQLCAYGDTYDVQALSRLLSSGRVGVDFVHLSVIALVDQVKAGVYSSVRPGVVITTSLLFDRMHILDSWIHGPAAEVFRHTETQYLLMPAFLKKSEHYFALVIDKQQKRILIGMLFSTVGCSILKLLGDSLKTLWKDSKEMITTWTKSILGFEPTYAVMDHPVQDDTTICGVATVNIMEHFLVEATPLMTPAMKDELRLQYSIRLVALVQRKVGCASVLLLVADRNYRGTSVGLSKITCMELRGPTNFGNAKSSAPRNQTPHRGRKSMYVMIPTDYLNHQ